MVEPVWNLILIYCTTNLYSLRGVSLARDLVVDECGPINMWLVTPKHGGRLGESPMISRNCMQLANSTNYILANHLVFVKATQIVS